MTLPRITLSPSDPEFVQNPHTTYARWHHDGVTAFWWQDYQMWCLSSFDLVDIVLRDRRFGRQVLHLTDRQLLGWPQRPARLADFDAVEAHSLLELEPPEHTKLRRLVNRAFVSRQVETLRPTISTMAHDLIDGFQADGSADMLADYIAPLAITTICRLLGVDDSCGQRLLDWSHAMVKMYVPGPGIDDQLAANEAAKAFRNWVMEAIKQAQDTPNADTLLTALCGRDHDGLALTNDEIVSTVILLLNAGHEATVHQFGNGLDVLLSQTPDWPSFFDEKLKATQTVNELLRLNAPLHMFTRYALQDMTLETPNGTITLRLGDKVGLLLAAANHDPKRFGSPGLFRPQRDDQANLSFGAGIHFCLGAPLARLELEEAYKAVAHRLPHARFVNPPCYADTFHFHGLKHALLRW